MQMEADTVRKKYQAVRASLKSDDSLYASCLNSLQTSIREQESEIKRLEVRNRIVKTGFNLAVNRSFLLIERENRSNRLERHDERNFNEARNRSYANK